ENYYKTINIEAHTAVDMVKHRYMPAVMAYEKFLCDTAFSKKNVGLDASIELDAAQSVSGLEKEMAEKCRGLTKLLDDVCGISDVRDLAVFYHDKVLAQMNELRAAVDGLESIIGEDYWCVPSIGEILFSVK
ncbi:MAG: glutamine synthetase type III, partial [Ruminiclostridium sp.]|nr:glutamine synthetase type III [Ruminiclostridium sp.]